MDSREKNTKERILAFLTKGLYRNFYDRIFKNLYVRKCSLKDLKKHDKKPSFYYKKS